MLGKGLSRTIATTIIKSSKENLLTMNIRT